MFLPSKSLNLTRSGQVRVFHKKHYLLAPAPYFGRDSNAANETLPRRHTGPGETLLPSHAGIRFLKMAAYIEKRKRKICKFATCHDLLDPFHSL